MSKVAREGKRLGVGALVLALVVPDVALLILVGVAFGWWIAAVIFGGGFAGVVVTVLAVRSKGSLRYLFEPSGDGPHEDRLRYLVGRRLALVLPVSFAVVLTVIVCSAYRASGVTTVIVSVATSVATLVVASWLWIQSEKKREAEQRENEALLSTMRSA